MKGIYLLIFLLVPVVSACDAKYVRPSDGPVAKIRYVSEAGSSQRNAGVFLVENNDCGSKKLIAALNGILLVHNRTDLGLPLGEQYAKNQKTETVIRANVPHTFDFGWSDGNIYSQVYKCSKTITFTPKEGKVYEAIYSLKDAGECSVNLTEIVKKENGEYGKAPVNDAKLNDVQCQW